MKFLPNHQRLYCTARNLKCFKDVPQLKSYPMIGHSYLFMPGGKYKAERLTEAVLDMSKTLGNIFRLNLGGTNLLVTLDADHAPLLFRNEGTRPIRAPFAALVLYRQKAFNSVGVVPGNGEEWYKFRKGVTPLLKTEIIGKYKEAQRDVAQAFVRYIEKKKDGDGVVHGLYQHLLKFSIEAISLVSPGYRFMCLEGDNQEETEQIIKASVDFMDGLYATMMEPPVWRFWKTPGYKKLESSHDTIYRILKGRLETIKKKHEENPENLRDEYPYMNAILSNENISWDDVIMLAMEVFLGGIDATSTTIGFTLHYLARFEEIQELARDDRDGEFLKACIKETLRLRPTAGASGRFIVNDANIGGYIIPKGTMVLVFNSAMSHNPEYFTNPYSYHPQRWIRGKRENYHKFASLPFGYGPRMCPGRRVAENEIVILLKEILDCYKLKTPDGKDINMVYRMNRIPDSPINIQFLNNTNH